MSRGLGKTQRYVLDRLRELRAQGDLRHHDAYSLAASMRGEADPSRSAVQSVRQAIRRLAKLGLVEIEYIHGAAEGRPPRVVPGRYTWLPSRIYNSPTHSMLSARLPLTGEQEAAEEETRRAVEARFGLA